MKNLFTTEVENAMVQIINNNGFKYRKSKTGSLKVVLQNNYYSKEHDLNRFDTPKNNKVLTIGMTTCLGKEVYSFRVSGPSYYAWVNDWVTPICYKHWTDDVADVLAYLNTYLNKKQSERDY